MNMQVEEIPKQSRNSLLKTAFNATSFLKARENFFLFFLYSILLYMKKLSNTLNHSNKLMSTFFCAVFINIYFEIKHSNETFHLGLYSLLNVFSYRKHINSKSNISLLTISRVSRNIKIIAPSPPFYYQTPSPSHFMV